MVLLKAVAKFVPRCEFICDKSGTTIRSYDGKSRVEFKTNTMISQDTLSFCTIDLRRVMACFKQIKEHEGKTSINIDYHGGTLQYNGNMNFKIYTDDRDIVERFVTKEITLEDKMDEDYTFTTSVENLKKLYQLRTIISDDSTKVYFQHKDGNIIGELDNKDEHLFNSIGIPISSEPITGGITNVYAVAISDIDCFTIMPATSMTMKWTTNGALFIKGEFREFESRLTSRRKSDPTYGDKYVESWISMYMVCSAASVT